MGSGFPSAKRAHIDGERLHRPAQIALDESDQSQVVVSGLLNAQRRIACWMLSKTRCGSQPATGEWPFGGLLGELVGQYGPVERHLFLARANDRGI